MEEQTYLDEDGLKLLVQQAKKAMSYSEEYQQIIIELLERLLLEDKIQRIVKLKETVTISGNTSTIIRSYCGYDAYEIKTIEIKNLTTNTPIQVEILENDVNQKVLYKSHPSNYIYTNTGEVCNIDEENNKSVYLRITNLIDSDIEISLEVKLVNLLAVEGDK